MKLLRFLHASLLVSDLETALKFYINILGMRINKDRPDLGYPGAWLDLGEQQIHLMQLPNPDEGTCRPEHGGRDRHLAFAVDSVDELKVILQKNNLPFTLSRSGRRALFCRDPDGNALEFSE